MAIRARVAVTLAVMLLAIAAVCAPTDPPATPSDPVVRDFQARVDSYMKLRNTARLKTR